MNLCLRTPALPQPSGSTIEADPCQRNVTETLWATGHVHDDLRMGPANRDGKA
jgi:hypothetical protein